MKINTFKTLSLSVATLALMSTSTMANEMVNNTAIGFVGGDIRQFSNDYDRETRLDVGAIVADEARGTTVEGTILGNVTQSAEGYSKAIAQVGAVKADLVDNTTARGFVGGEIYQEAYGYHDEAIAEVRVGAIDTGGSGYSSNNTAEGYVSGSIVQSLSDGSNARARIGSMTTEN